MFTCCSAVVVASAASAASSILRLHNFDNHQCQCQNTLDLRRLCPAVAPLAAPTGPALPTNRPDHDRSVDMVVRPPRILWPRFPAGWGRGRELGSLDLTAAVDNVAATVSLSQKWKLLRR